MHTNTHARTQLCVCYSYHGNHPEPYRQMPAFCVTSIFSVTVLGSGTTQTTRSNIGEREREREGWGGVGERKQLQQKNDTTQTEPPVTSPVPPKPLLDLSNVSLLLGCHPDCPVRSC